MVCVESGPRVHFADLNSDPVHVTVTPGTIHVRWIKYVKPAEPHEPEALCGVIDGHTFVWVWRQGLWDEFVRCLAEQAARQDTPLIPLDAVALYKLRLESVR